MTEPDEATIAEIRTRVGRASAGPWTLTRDDRGARAIATGRPDRRRLYIKRDLVPASEGDIAFIALARTALPRLVEAIANDETDLLAAGELEKIDAAVAAASSGLWIAFLEDKQPIGGCSMIWVGDDPNAPDMYVWLEDEIAPSVDIEFIASAREDIPALLSEIRYRRRKGCSSRR
jgi:hypothetical protein